MKPKEAKKLLNCSYTTLHNYVKSGKIKCVKTDYKQQIYDDQSVLKLYDEINAINIKLNNTIHIFINNNKYEFNLNKNIIEKIFDVISKELSEDIE